jgi:hypothetical protein
MYSYETASREHIHGPTLDGALAALQIEIS